MKKNVEVDMSKKEEISRALIKGTIEVLPYAGGLLSNILDVYLPQTLKSRREKIIEQLALEIDQAIEADVTIEKSLIYEENQTLLLKLFKLSEMELEENKIAELRNIFINSLFRQDIGIDKKGVFLNLASDLTLRHLIILKIMDNPLQALSEKGCALNITMGGIESLFNLLIEDYSSEAEFYKMIYENLQSYHLLAKGGLGVTMSAEGILSPRTTNFGKEFVSFLKTPNSRKKVV